METKAASMGFSHFYQITNGKRVKKNGCAKIMK
jgi:hypothetical protein